MHMARINGVALHYVQVDSQRGPDAEDLVLVHGLATSMAFWYFQYAAPLSRRYRLTFFDLRGHGRSDMPEQGYTPQDLSRDLQGLLDHLGIGRAHVLAHSFGGVVALDLACREPDRVASLVLADTHISAVRNARASAGWAHGDTIQAILDAHGIALDTRDPYFGYRLLTVVAGMQTQKAPVPPALLELVAPLLGRPGRRTAAQWLRLMRSNQAASELMGDDGLTLERLQRLRVPTMAMYGSRSPARLTGSELLQVWPHAQFRSIRDGGHFFPTSRVAEVVSSCNRFWSGELSHESLRRHGETAGRFFRSDRIYQTNGEWYCLTRESPPIGPYPAFEEARRRLATYLAERLAG
jgi:pimeloyl-ACP methyl ester carboxylesterase